MQYLLATKSIGHTMIVRHFPSKQRIGINHQKKTKERVKQKSQHVQTRNVRNA